MRNKDQKKKCKGQESTIGKIIYGFLLFLPLLAIATTCLYAIFNKNAYQSYYGENINDYIVENTNNLEVNTEYYFSTRNSNLTQLTTTQNYVYVNELTNLEGANNINGTNVRQFKIYYAENEYTSIEFRYSNNVSTFVRFAYQGNVTNTISFNFKPTTNQNTSYENIFSYNIYDKVSFVSEVFYYSIDRVTQSPLFNWAENSIIYTTTNATCNALSITTPFIPLLMSYWLIISVIYFLYDIALMLVWIIHRKIHELQESI